MGLQEGGREGEVGRGGVEAKGKREEGGLRNVRRKNVSRPFHSLFIDAES